MIRFIRNAFSFGKKDGQLAMIIYTFQLLLALIVGLQVYQVLDASVGSSLNTRKLLDGFNHTVISDFMNVHGASLSPILGQVRWFTILYLIFGSFISGGIISYFIDGSSQIRSFWKGGGLHFKKVFVLNLIYLVIFSIVAAIIAAFVHNAVNKAQTVEITELPFLRKARISAVLLIFVLTVTILLSITSKIALIVDDLSVWKSMKAGFRTLTQHWVTILLVSAIFLFISVAAFVLQKCIGDIFIDKHLAESSMAKGSSLLVICLVFVLQQLILIFKNLLRILYFRVFYTLKTESSA